MKVQVISDLHREFGSLDINFKDADVIVLAGDIDLGIKGIQWIKSSIVDIPVIYVVGNHEYYRGSYPKTLIAIQQLSKGTNIHLLENQSVMLNGVTFHGATLWTDFRLFGDSRNDGAICQEKMNDYKMIRRDPSYSKLRSIDTFLIHQQSVQWLTSSLESTETAKNIVVTHHAPSAKSLPKERRSDVVSAAYASNLETMVLKYQPQYWVHGHIHTPSRYQLGGTTVVCNPHGYIHEPYNGFDKELMIEI